MEMSNFQTFLLNAEYTNIPCGKRGGKRNGTEIVIQVKFNLFFTSKPYYK
jgi:hypothetical protein